MNKTINVGIDLDGVCANFGLIYSAIANKLYGPKCYIINQETEIEAWNWYEWYPITREEDKVVWEYISKSQNFWTALTVLNKYSFIHMTKSLQDLQNVNVYFITARAQTRGLSVAKQSVLWLNQHGWRNPQVIVTKLKGDFARILELDYFIDDKGENVVDVKASYPECEVYIHSAPHNKNVEKEINGIIRVNNLSEFTNDILKNLTL